MATAELVDSLRSMANRKKRASKPTTPPPDGPDDGGPVLFIRMPPQVQAAFNAAKRVDSLERGRQDLGLEALTEWLERKGLWPPPKPPR